MSDTQEVSGPVDNSHLAAGIAARDAKIEAKTTEVAEQAAEIVEDDIAEAQNDTEDSAATERDDDPARSKKKQSAGSRINELTREKYDAIRERDAMRQELEALRNPKAADTTNAQAARTEAKPTLEDFDYDPDAYYTALAKWQVDAELASREQKAQQRKQQESAAEKAKAFKDREAAFAAKNPDYYDKAYTAPIQYSEAMLEAIQDSDQAPAIAYHLANNLDDANAISRMSPLAAAKAIGRIEAQLSAPAVARTPQPKTVTNAPAPVTTLTGSPTVKKSHADMSMREYDEQRRKERAARG